MVEVALFKPDIPQNTAAIVRTLACFESKLHIIEPCGFNLDDQRFKRVVMDYTNLVKIYRYSDFSDFIKKNPTKKIVLFTTKSDQSLYNFKFSKTDIILFGRESAGVPEEVHLKVNDRIKIPMQKEARSLNISTAVGIGLAEAIRQTKTFE